MKGGDNITDAREPGGARALYGFTQHPDRNLGREAKRHLVTEGNHRRTLCGQPVRWLWDYATPLSPDCKNCLRAAQTHDAALRSWP